MRVSTFLAVAAAIAVFFGIFQLVAPGTIARMYGVNLSDPAFFYVTRLLGSPLLGIGIIGWLARNGSHAVVHPVLVGILVSSAVGLLASLHRVFTGGAAMNWLNVLIYLGLVVGSMVLLARKSDTLIAEQKLA